VRVDPSNAPLWMTRTRACHVEYVAGQLQDMVNRLGERHELVMSSTWNTPPRPIPSRGDVPGKHRKA
jgi:hypothetical protein